MPDVAREQDRLFEEAMSSYGGALERLARAYEADAEVLRDLLQEIHIALYCLHGVAHAVQGLAGDD